MESLILSDWLVRFPLIGFDQLAKYEVCCVRKSCYARRAFICLRLIKINSDSSNPTLIRVPVEFHFLIWRACAQTTKSVS